MQARFDAVEDCTAGLSVLQPIHQQEDNDEGDNETSLVANLACTYREGSGPQHIADLARHMGAVMEGMGADGPGFAYVRTPITGGPNFPDLFLTSVFDNTEHWTRYVMQLFSTEEGERMRNHMDMVVDCNISMWSAEQVVTPTTD